MAARRAGRTNIHALPKPGSWSHAALLAPSARYLALFAVTASLLLPFSTGWDVCLLHRTTGLPCPGCGMTRAFVALASGDWRAALGANPFVLLAYPTFLVLALTALVPSGAAGRFDAWVTAHGRFIGRAYGLCGVAFLAFGAGRFLLFLGMGAQFP